MGVVYLARDTKLDRDVAIKALPPEVVDDEEKLTHVEREAKLLASLNHPNIAAICGLEESNPTRFGPSPSWTSSPILQTYYSLGVDSPLSKD